MKPAKIISCILLIAALSSLLLTLLTDWNDALFLPLALSALLAANLIHLLVHNREKKGGDKNDRSGRTH